MTRNNEHSLAYLGFQLQAPSPHLAEYVRNYWAIDRTTPLVSPQQEFLYPEGGSGLIYNYGSPIQFNGDIPSSQFTMDGASTWRTCVKFQGAINAIGIRFHLGGGFPFLRFPLSELKNQFETLESLGLKRPLQIGHQMADCASFRERVEVIESALTELLSKSPDQPPRHFFSTIQKQINSQTTVTSLAQSIGISSRQLERYFKKYVGMTPREYIRLRRVEAAREMLKQNNHRTCTQIGYDVGFYDQSHFVREFQSITGMTPKFYRDRKRKPGTEVRSSA